MTTTRIARPYEALADIGRVALATSAYLGALGLMSLSACQAMRNPRGRSEGSLETAISLRSSTAEQLGWMLAMSMPVVAVAHAGLGAFLAMQAYYGGTFVEGTGAVVGVGLIRNVAPMMSGILFAIILAARVTPELHLLARASGGDSIQAARLPFLADPPSRPIRDDVLRRVAAIVIAAACATLVLNVWSAGVGTLVGWSVGRRLMGVSTHNFFTMYWEMLWYRDVTGLFFKGLMFGPAAAVCACHEGIRLRDGATFGEVANAAGRAAFLASAAVFLMNSAWFLVLYHAGSAFGPTLLQPPAP